jgi:hypothetical protein
MHNNILVKANLCRPAGVHCRIRFLTGGDSSSRTRLRFNPRDLQHELMGTFLYVREDPKYLSQVTIVTPEAHSHISAMHKVSNFSKTKKSPKLIAMLQLYWKPPMIDHRDTIYYLRPII